MASSQVVMITMEQAEQMARDNGLCIQRVEPVEQFAKLVLSSMLKETDMTKLGLFKDGVTRVVRPCDWSRALINAPFRSHCAVSLSRKMRSGILNHYSEITSAIRDTFGPCKKEALAVEDNLLRLVTGLFECTIPPKSTTDDYIARQSRAWDSVVHLWRSLQEHAAPDLLEFMHVVSERFHILRKIYYKVPLLLEPSVCDTRIRSEPALPSHTSRSHTSRSHTSRTPPTSEPSRKGRLIKESMAAQGC